MATDNLSYQEVKDHNELMSSMRNVMSKASVLFNKLNPNQIADHNSATDSHADIRQSLANIESEIDVGNTEIYDSIETLRSDTTSKLEVIDSKIASIESLNTSQSNSIVALTTTTDQLSRDSATHTTKITGIESSISTINSTNSKQDTNISKLQNNVNTLTTTVEALSSAELTDLMSSTFTKDTSRDGGMWRDDSYVPFVNEDNLAYDPSVPAGPIASMAATTAQLVKDSAAQATKITGIESSISTITSVNNDQGTKITALQGGVSTINTTIAPITSSELSTLMSSTFTKDTSRDGGMWRDDSYVPFVNEDNLAYTEEVTGGEPEASGTE